MAARCEGQELAAASTCEAARALSGPSSITAAQATAAGSMRIISRVLLFSRLPEIHTRERDCVIVFVDDVATRTLWNESQCSR